MDIRVPRLRVPKAKLILVPTLEGDHWIVAMLVSRTKELKIKCLKLFLGLWIIPRGDLGLEHI